MNERRVALLWGLILFGAAVALVWIGRMAWYDSGIRMGWTDSFALSCSICFFLLAIVCSGIGAFALWACTMEKEEGVEGVEEEKAVEREKE